MKEQISRAVYSAIHEYYCRETQAGRDTHCDIYYNPDTQDVRAVSSGADYPGIKIMDNVQASDFLTYDNPATYTKDEFIDACLTAYGYVEIPKKEGEV